MRDLSGWRAGLLSLAVLVLQACASTGSSTTAAAGASGVEQAQTAFRNHLKGCTAQYGFDPSAAHNLGPYELGPHEREWRQCAYQGVQSILIPRASNPDMYYRAISQDELMTDMIEQKKMTRGDRQARLDQLRAQILGAERASADEQKRKELELTRSTVTMLQGVNPI